MPKPPTTRKPIPLDPIRWRAEVDGVRRFIAQLEQTDCGEGQAWQDRMLAYNRLRLADLQDNRPPSKRKRQRRASKG